MTEPLKWFNQHPVIATILWILGTEEQKAPTEVEYNSKENILSWKDDHGGHIAEFMHVIQRKQEDTPTNASTNTSTNTSTSTSTSTSVTNDYYHMNSHTHNNKLNHHNQNHGTNNNTIADADTTPSPQWGFYVSITPPQPEIYMKEH